MSTSARRRLLRDFRRLQGDPPSGVTGAPMDTNIMLWQAVIFGPDDTPWEGGTFKLVLEFTEDYPNKAPSVRFLTKMFHPNICEWRTLLLVVVFDISSSLPAATVRCGWWCYLGSYMKESFMFAFSLIIHQLSFLPIYHYIHKTRTNNTNTRQ